MYKHNSVGPWPIVDLFSDPVVFGDHITTDVRSELRLNISLPNLPVSYSSYMRFGELSDASIPALHSLTYAVGLKCPFDLLPSNLLVDVNGDITGLSSSRLLSSFFIGHSTNAPTNGVLLTSYSLLSPSHGDSFYTQGFSVGYNSEIVLPLDFSEFDSSDHFYFGFSLFNETDAPVTTRLLFSSLSARFAFSSIDTLELSR